MAGHRRSAPRSRRSNGDDTQSDTWRGASYRGRERSWTAARAAAHADISAAGREAETEGPADLPRLRPGRDRLRVRPGAVGAESRRDRETQRAEERGRHRAARAAEARRLRAGGGREARPLRHAATERADQYVRPWRCMAARQLAPRRVHVGDL